MSIRSFVAATAALASCPASAAVVLDINQNQASAPFTYTNRAQIVSQSFRATKNNIAGAGFSLDLRATAEMTYTLYTANPTAVGSVALGSATVTATGSGFADAFFASPIALVVGQTYFLAVQSTVDKFVSCQCQTNPYANGSAYFGADADLSDDLTFRTYYDDAFVLAAVPEPATWGLMLAGFGLIGAGLRSRRPGVRFPAA